MPNDNEWLFEILWELSDKAQDAELPALAEKLEEAMDVYLAECEPGGCADVGFQSQRYTDANDRVVEMAKTKARTLNALNALVAQARTKQVKPSEKRQPVPPRAITVSGQQTVQSFAWPL